MHCMVHATETAVAWTKRACKRSNGNVIRATEQSCPLPTESADPTSTLVLRPVLSCHLKKEKEAGERYGWFQRLWDNATPIGTPPTAERVVAVSVKHIDLTHYLGKPLPAMCEMANVGADEEAVWTIGCSHVR